MSRIFDNIEKPLLPALQPLGGLLTCLGIFVPGKT